MNGELPETLDELVSEYIDSVPIDGYDGKPLRYSKEKKIIYTIGHNLKDTGGPDPEELLKRRIKPGHISWRVDDPGILINF